MDSLYDILTGGTMLGEAASFMVLAALIYYFGFYFVGRILPRIRADRDVGQNTDAKR